MALCFVSSHTCFGRCLGCVWVTCCWRLLPPNSPLPTPSHMAMIGDSPEDQPAAEQTTPKQGARSRPKRARRASKGSAPSTPTSPTAPSPPTSPITPTTPSSPHSRGSFSPDSPKYTLFHDVIWLTGVHSSCPDPRALDRRGQLLRCCHGGLRGLGNPRSISLPLPPNRVPKHQLNQVTLLSRVHHSTPWHLEPLMIYSSPRPERPSRAMTPGTKLGVLGSQKNLLMAAKKSPSDGLKEPRL